MKKLTIVLISASIGFLLGTIAFVIIDTPVPTNLSIYCQINTDRDYATELYLGTILLTIDSNEDGPTSSEMAQFMYSLAENVIFSVYDRRYKVDTESIVRSGDSQGWHVDC